MFITVSAIELTLVTRIEQIIRVPYLCSLLFLDELGDRVCHWLRHKLQSMLSLLLVSVVKTLIFIEMPIYLLDLRHFPTKVFLRLCQAIRPVACMHLSISIQSDFPSIAIELLEHSFFRFSIVIACLVAIKLFPSLCLGCSHYRQLRSEDAIFVVFVS